MRKTLYSTSQTVANLCAWIAKVRRTISALLNAMAAPLRRILARDVDVTLPDPHNHKYRIYSLVDTLECGHVQESYLFGGLQDLIFAYTTNPDVSAKRRRCRPCAQLLAERKPMQTVTAIRAAKTA